MKVAECMTKDVRTIAPRQSISEAAKIMRDINAGVLPVGDGDRLVGMVTDRDIAIRAIAEGKGPGTPVIEVMTGAVRYCFEDEDLDHVARNMGELQVRRLPVVNRDKRLVGMVSLGDLAQPRGGAARSGDALRKISQPGTHA